MKYKEKEPFQKALEIILQLATRGDLPITATTTTGGLRVKAEALQARLQVFLGQCSAEQRALLEKTYHDTVENAPPLEWLTESTEPPLEAKATVTYGLTEGKEGYNDLELHRMYYAYYAATRSGLILDLYELFSGKEDAYSHLKIIAKAVNDAKNGDEPCY